MFPYDAHAIQLMTNTRIEELSRPGRYDALRPASGKKRRANSEFNALAARESRLEAARSSLRGL